MAENEKRKFSRHSLEIPIIIQLGDVVYNSTEYLNDISIGGLSFKSAVDIASGSIIDIRIPLVRPVFKTRGKVVRSKKNGNFYDVAIRFTETADAFRMRMIEQICHIQSYKKKLVEKEGRQVTGEQAAIDWIQKYADCFPELDDYKNGDKNGTKD
jgi:hypothetical protein